MSQNGTTLNLQPTSSPTIETPATMETPAIAPPPPPPSPNMFGEELAHNTSNPPPINPSPVISTAIPSPIPQSSPPPINPPPPPVPVQTMPVPVPPSQPSSPPPPVPSPPPLPVPVDPIQGSSPSPTVPVIQTQPQPEIAEPAYQSPPLPPSQISTSEPPPSTPLPDQSTVTVPVPVPVFVPVYVPTPQSQPPPLPLSVPSTSNPTSLTPRPPLAPPMKSSAQSPGETEFLSGTPLVPVHKTAINTSSIVGIGVAIFLVVSLLVGLVVYLLKRKNRRHNGSDTDYHDIYSPSQNTPPSLVGSDNCYQMGTISYRHLSEITENFAQGNLIGEGGFARVYKGVINEGANRREVAVKQLKIEKNKGIQGERDFNTELEIIQRIHHRHLVDLLGYCLTDIHRVLVYEFVPNQTLDFHLHGSGPVMEWRYRMRAAIGSARGIGYLHEDCQPKIIHRDIKSANILLDNSFEAKVADFGLAKFTNDSNTHISTRVVGTFGYMAPEYALSGKLTEKSDVFSFGVVLLELITGRKPVNSSDADEGLVEWARPLLAPALETQNFEILVDPKLGLNYVKTEMHRMINIAASCVRHSAINRPRMIQVLRSLEDETHFSDLSNGVRIGDSTTYDSRLYSLEINRLHNMSFASSSS